MVTVLPLHTEARITAFALHTTPHEGHRSDLPSTEGRSCQKRPSERNKTSDWKPDQRQNRAAFQVDGALTVVALFRAVPELPSYRNTYAGGSIGIPLKIP
jgi:hypothetical protein